MSTVQAWEGPQPLLHLDNGSWILDAPTVYRCLYDLAPEPRAEVLNHLGDVRDLVEVPILPRILPLIPRDNNTPARDQPAPAGTLKVNLAALATSPLGEVSF